MSYLFVIHSTTFVVKMLIVDEFLIFNGIVLHITGPEYDILFLNKFMFGLGILHGPSMFAVKAKIYGVLYNQASSVAFDETSIYWSALKSS